MLVVSELVDEDCLCKHFEEGRTAEEVKVDLAILAIHGGNHSLLNANCED